MCCKSELLLASGACAQRQNRLATNPPLAAAFNCCHAVVVVALLAANCLLTACSACPCLPCLPSADTGKVGGKLLGMATTRDWDFVTDLHTPLSEVMTTDLETAQYGEQGQLGSAVGEQGQYGGQYGR